MEFGNEPRSQAERREPGEQRRKGYLRLTSRQRSTGAQVRSASKSEMGIMAPVQIKGRRMRKDRRIAVGRLQLEDDLLPCRDGGITDLDVLFCPSCDEARRSDQAEEFLNQAFDQCWSCSQFFAHVPYLRNFLPEQQVEPISD